MRISAGGFVAAATEGGKESQTLERRTLPSQSPPASGMTRGALSPIYAEIGLAHRIPLSLGERVLTRAYVLRGMSQETGDAGRSVLVPLSGFNDTQLAPWVRPEI